MKKLAFYNYTLLLFCLFYFIKIVSPNLSLSLKPFSLEEICNNAIDDDNDGLIDLNDPDCDCPEIDPVSLIPNPSFEEMDCCPDDKSQLYCATDWIQASQATTDFIHTCGWLGWDEFPAPTPFPDGEGIMGFRDGRIRQNGIIERDWKEYAGACLLSPLEANVSYRFEFDLGFVDSLKSPPINISFFGSTDCANLPFGLGNNNFGCPTNGSGWLRLGSTLVSGGAGNIWRKGSIEVVPEVEINAIVIGPDCPHVESEVNTFYFFDNLILADLESFPLQIEAVNHPCSEDFRLQVTENAAFSYQWYKEGIALIGEVASTLSQIYGEGAYQVRVDDGTDCKTSIEFDYRIPVLNTTLLNERICKGNSFLLGDQSYEEAGTYVDTFPSIHNCDSIVQLNLTIAEGLSDTIRVILFEGETYEIGNYSFSTGGDYLVPLKTPENCDSLLLVQLEYYRIYIPNAFSPNYDGTNDVFSILGGEDYLRSRSLLIFDRWGGLLFEGEAWDGRYKGKTVNPGVFTYLAKVVLHDGSERQFSGSVTVIR